MGQLPPPPFFVLRGHEGGVSALHFTNEIESYQPTLISGSEKGEIFFWDLKIFRTYCKISGHENKSILSLAYYKSSLLSHGRDGFLNVWQCANHQWTIIKKFPSVNVGFCASVFYPVENGEARIVLFNDDKSLLEIYSYETMNSLQELGMDSTAGMCMCIKVFKRGPKTCLLTGYENGHIALWDIESESEICQVKIHAESVMCLDFDSNHQNRGISGSVDEFLETWEITENLQISKIHRLAVTNPGVNAVTIRDDGKIVITAGYDYNVRVFSWKTLKLLAVLNFHDLSIHCLSYSPVSVGKQKSVFASGSKDKRIALWSLY